MLICVLDAAPDQLLDAYLRSRRGGTSEQVLESARALHADRGGVSVSIAAGDEAAMLRAGLVAEAAGQIASADADWGPAAEHFDRASVLFDAAGDRDESVAALMLAMSTRASDPETDIGDLVGISDEMGGIAQALAGSDAARHIVLDARLCYALALLERNQFPRAAAQLDEAEPLATADHELARLLGVRALIAAGSGDDRTALEVALRALDLARAAHDRVQQGYLLMFVAGHRGEAGDIAEALELVGEAIEHASLIGRPFEVAALRLRSSLRLVGGDSSGAHEDIQRAADLVRTTDESRSVVPAILGLATLLLTESMAADALDLLDRNAGLLDDSGDDLALDAGKIRFAACSALDRTADAAVALRQTAEVMARTHHHEARTAWDVAAELYETIGEIDEASYAREQAARLDGD